MPDQDHSVQNSPPEAPRNAAAILHEPLLHFVVIAGLLFLAAHFTGQKDASSRTVHVTAEQQQVLKSGFERDYYRAPDATEMEALVQDWVRTEVCNREARALGLDQDDQLIRDHLRSKYELLLDDGRRPPEPTEEQLREFLQAHPEKYRTEDAVAFRQVYIDPLAREDADTDAALLLSQLTGEEELGTVQALSDPSSLPPRLPLVALSEVGWQFDPDFAQLVAAAPVGRWSGPYLSSYGLHLVFVEQHEPGRELALDEIRTDVERDWVYEQQQQRLDAKLDELLAQYTVVLDPVRKETAPSAQADDEAAGPGQ